MTPYQQSLQRALFRRLLDESTARYLQRTPEKEMRTAEERRRGKRGVRFRVTVGGVSLRLGLSQADALRRLERGEAPGDVDPRALEKLERHGLFAVDDGRRVLTALGVEVLGRLT